MNTPPRFLLLGLVLTAALPAAEPVPAPLPAELTQLALAPLLPRDGPTARRVPL